MGSCYGCEEFGDCVSGQCLQSDLSNPYSARVCWEDCTATDCLPYTECMELSDDEGNTFHLCGAESGMTCVQVQRCQEGCPDGPGSCSADAPNYC